MLFRSKPIMPLLFAGVLMEGAVIGFDTNIKSGGIGARYLDRKSVV